MVSADQRVETGATQPDGRSAKRVGGALIGIVLLGLKAEAYRNLLSAPRVVVLVLLGLTAVIALVYGRPLRMAAAGGAFVGVAVDPASVLLRIGFGVAAVVALVAVSVAVGSLLQRLDRGAVA